MKIDLQTKIGALLDAYPDLERTLLSLSPAFAKLQNPILRRTVAQVTTIQQAAKIAGISPMAMIQALREAAITVRFDARPVIEAGESPMKDILRISGALESGQIMELTAPFRPEPIMDMLRSKGFSIWYDSDTEKCYIRR